MKRQNNNLKGGFTLVEMLVVIGILGILAATMTASFSHVKIIAQQSQAQSQVSEVAAAFNLYLQQEREWPLAFTSKTEIDKDVCVVFQKKNLLDLTTCLRDGSGNLILGSDGKPKVNDNSLDRFGLLDPWGRAALRKNPKISSADAKVEGGMKLSDHRLQFRLDKDFDGYVDAEEGSPKGLKVRASVLVWSRGPDGKDAETVGARYPGDDRVSWNFGLSRKEGGK